MEWLTSGLRRDICILLYDEERRAQSLKSAIETRYDRRVKPDRFYGALDALESRGFVDTRVEGLEDVHALTAAGRQHVEAQFEWMGERVEGERVEGERVEGERVEGERVEGERAEGERSSRGGGTDRR